ncbi:MAG: HU family DNA-binding protein, partial [Halapricum sp.]
MKDSSGLTTVSRRRLLQTVGTGTVVIGLGLGTIPGTAAAMNKAELIEAMASESGLSKADSKKALEGFTSATTNALTEGGSAVLIGFGSFSISKRSARTGRNPQSGKGPADDSPVTFDWCPEFAAALDLNPGKGDEASAKCRDADVIIDAKYLADETGRDSESRLSEADAKRAIDAFINVTTEALKKGDRLSLIGFGSFSISKRSARTGRNPQTGKEIQIAAKNVVKFKA